MVTNLSLVADRYEGLQSCHLGRQAQSIGIYEYECCGPLIPECSGSVTIKTHKLVSIDDLTFTDPSIFKLETPSAV
ncbi:hypothetical protein KIN20_029172 [Parelaphostrongylus tenuis]|uniref:Uncharacterized protein n=1 Tax=Parelaphostrongylus tenuis TaxID=148309 RepID=A0AAD5WFB6_PARTN|nr:hypothetical protein KIN20_029172 [Parelaphostrongylus tenuis]